MNRRDFLLTAGAVATAGRELVTPARLAAASKADHTIRIAPVSFEIAPGKTIQTIGYNGKVPGPLLRMKEGKPVTVDIFNDTDTPELRALAWHVHLDQSGWRRGRRQPSGPAARPSAR